MGPRYIIKWQSKPGSLVLESMYLTTMVHLAWTDTDNGQSEEESHTCACVRHDLFY